MARKSPEDIWAQIDAAEKQMRAANPPKKQISGNSGSTPNRSSFLNTIRGMFGNQISQQAKDTFESDPSVARATAQHYAQSAVGEQQPYLSPFVATDTQAPSGGFPKSGPQIFNATASPLTIAVPPVSANAQAGGLPDKATAASNFDPTTFNPTTPEEFIKSVAAYHAMPSFTDLGQPNPEKQTLGLAIQNYNEVSGRKTIADHQSRLDSQLFKVKAATITAQDATQNALANKNYGEAVRSNKAVEALRQEEFALSQKQQQLSFLQIISANPSILYYMKQLGVLDMLTSQLGLQTSDVIGQPLGQYSLPNVQQLAKMNPQQREQLFFQLEAQTGMSRQEIEQMIMSQQPGQGQTNRQTL